MFILPRPVNCILPERRGYFDEQLSLSAGTALRLWTVRGDGYGNMLEPLVGISFVHKKGKKEPGNILRFRFCCEFRELKPFDVFVLSS